jgi:hypothetical protein
MFKGDYFLTRLLYEDNEPQIFLQFLKKDI